MSWTSIPIKHSPGQSVFDVIFDPSNLLANSTEKAQFASLEFLYASVPSKVSGLSIIRLSKSRWAGRPILSWIFREEWRKYIIVTIQRITYHHYTIIIIIIINNYHEAYMIIATMETITCRHENARRNRGKHIIKEQQQRTTYIITIMLRGIGGKIWSKSYKRVT